MYKLITENNNSFDWYTLRSAILECDNEIVSFLKEGLQLGNICQLINVTFK